MTQAFRRRAERADEQENHHAHPSVVMRDCFEAAIPLLKDGKIAESGSPEQLLAQNGAYARMRKLQTQAQSRAIG